MCRSVEHAPQRIGALPTRCSRVGKIARLCANHARIARQFCQPYTDRLDEIDPQDAERLELAYGLLKKSLSPPVQ
jgi:hypothetical protein